jgi:hypothetical protein
MKTDRKGPISTILGHKSRSSDRYWYFRLESIPGQKRAMLWQALYGEVA